LNDHDYDLDSSSNLFVGKTITINATTDSNGKITFTQTFGSTDLRYCYATFRGASSYMASTKQ